MADDDEVIVERYASQCVLYMLSQHYKNTTIKRQDLIKTIFPEQNRKNTKLILDRAKYLLKQIYGINVVELGDNVKHYMLINQVDSKDVSFKWNDETRQQQALLLPVLSFIFMNGGVANENEIKTLLRKLKILSTINCGTEMFGDIEQLLKKNFVNQRYLNFNIVKSPNNQEEHIGEFTWGDRANLEVKREKILQFVSDLYGVENSYWAEQYVQTVN